ncbi:RCC1 domain-containing protein [Paenibacillus humicola]|uniref:RCC1 domain-containing protein n=1 Tax=Paenibacillus humicola TaxID=3110540 RepID=UPI00237AAC70|nr:RCC1 domain-containing protein [Paenibacillus humicola]
MKKSIRQLAGLICILIAFVTVSSPAAAAESGGAVQAQGDNGSQLNDGKQVNPAMSVAQTVYLAAGMMYSMALRNDGTVWSWGDNYAGELGDGTTTNRRAPVQVKTLTGVAGIAAGGQSLAVLNDGTVWEWGEKLPNGSYDSSPGPTPYQVRDNFYEPLESVAAVSAGYDHNLAVKRDGTVWAWGRNIWGQLGDGTVSDEYLYGYPAQVQGLNSVTAVSAGLAYSLALKSDGTVWAWGRNDYGELGDGSTVQQRTTPVQVQGLDSVTAIAAGSSQSLALKSDGTVWGWGKINNGDGTSTARNTPVQLTGLNGVIAIAAGSGHNLALKSDGTVWAWGQNQDGQLGDGSTVQRTTPVQVQGLDSATAISAGDYFSLALKSDGTVWGWGSNFSGELGGDDSPYLTPVKVQGLDTRSPETLLYPFNGTIFDFDANRILLKRVESSRIYLEQFNRADQSLVKAAELTHYSYSAELSAQGVMYTDGSTTYYWKDGAVQKSWDGQYYHKVNGNFAVLNDSVVNLTTGESRSLPDAQFDHTANNRVDLSPDGTVVYTSPNNPSNLYKSLPDGTLTTYEPPAPDSYYGALTDGQNIIYNVLLQDNGSPSKLSLRVRSAGDQITTIAENPFDTSVYYADPRESYEINNGWIAYKEYNEKAGRWILYVRSPEGETKQVYAAPQWKNVPLSIKQLAPDGTVVYKFQNTTYVYSAQAGRNVYSSSEPGELEYREHVIGGPGGEEYRFLAWYRLDGGLLYGVRL